MTNCVKMQQKTLVFDQNCVQFERPSAHTRAYCRGQNSVAVISCPPEVNDLEKKLSPLRKGRISPGGRRKVAGVEAGFAAHPPEYGPPTVRARMGAGSFHQQSFGNRSIVPGVLIQRPSGREGNEHESRWYAQSGKPPATIQRPPGGDCQTQVTFPQRRKKLYPNFTSLGLLAQLRRYYTILERSPRIRK
ncbi:MAG: hypothetical protein HY774_21640 [Acidobacteria bacterium]|nr:hypothetical protein [Acidobacteriota bacterium]